ncbi:hypothetical protein LguiB_023369 [Lonicera macranthoides]
MRSRFSNSKTGGMPRHKARSFLAGTQRRQDTDEGVQFVKIHYFPVVSWIKVSVTPPIKGVKTRAPPRADSSFCSSAYGVLAAVSSPCSPPKGRFLRDLATVDSILLRELSPLDDKDAYGNYNSFIREVDQSIAQCDYPSTRLVGSARGDESTEELEILKGIDTMMVLHDLPYNEEKAGRVQAARKDDLVIGAGTNAGVLLIDRFGDGLLLEAPDQDFDFLGNTSFNLLQGCRMRNIKTIFTSRSSGPAPCGFGIYLLTILTILTSDYGLDTAEVTFKRKI